MLRAAGSGQRVAATGGEMGLCALSLGSPVSGTERKPVSQLCSHNGSTDTQLQDNPFQRKAIVAVIWSQELPT
eukprot:1148645-Pelagomonas_calceolata.AAC.3